MSKAAAVGDNRAAAIGALLLGENVSSVAQKYGSRPGGKKIDARHALLVFGGSVVALLVVLRVKGKDLRADNSPVGLAIKALLVLVCVTLLWYPFELFLAGPSRVQKALKM
jgi:hypothetical protein